MTDTKDKDQADPAWPDAPAAPKFGLVERPRTILQEAQDIIDGQRSVDYGASRLGSFGDIAAGWSMVLGHEVTPEQVVLCMIQLKVARAKGGGFHRDSFVDIAGYARCFELIAEEREAGDL